MCVCVCVCVCVRACVRACVGGCVCALYLGSVVPDDFFRSVASTMLLQQCLRNHSFSKGKSLSLFSKWKHALCNF